MIHRHRIRAVAIIAPILGVTLALGLAPASATAAPSIATATTPAPALGYVAVIDAGSSGTRLNLYAPGDGLTVTRLYRPSLTTPGLSSFAANPDNAGPEAVTPLLEALRDYLEAEGIASINVPVALLATAGLRRLNETNPRAVKAILASTRTAITSSTLPLRANGILPDFREAVLAWVDANALAGTLASRAPNVGIIEVGGASAQVAFHSPRSKGPGVRAVRVDGRTLRTVAVSYLGLGANEARMFMQVTLAGGDECFPNNVLGVDPTFYVADSAQPVASDEANFRGSPCGRAYASVVREVARTVDDERLRPRRLNSLPGFNAAGFVGLGVIDFTYSDFQIDPDADERRALDTAVRSTCKGVDAWTTVRALFSAPTPQTAEVLCSSGSYVSQFLFGPWGIDVAPDHLDAQPDLPGGPPSWPAGYAITALHP